ncbi:MAG: UDP-N-acetylmuramoyl-L-alanyl-D-glutamate--2,6-diaminopimelate ligase [Bacillota bacterium]
MIALEQLIKGMPYTVLQGSTNRNICNVQYDSRKVETDDVFVCITGFASDGHAFAEKAVDQGATVLVCEHALDFAVPESVTVLQVENSRKALAELSASFENHPSEQLQVVGITGTNGKTTVTYLVQSIFRELGKDIGLVGTIENRIGDEVLATERTTPESKELQALFSTMVERKISTCAMEISSHALDLYRVHGTKVEVAVLTNMTQDHLDYHHTMENYKQAKGKLFAMAKKCVINMDDLTAEYMMEQTSGDILTYGIDKTANLQAKALEISQTGIQFLVDYQGESHAVRLSTPGRFSVYNALAAMGVGLQLGIPMATIISGLSKNEGVSGRFESVQGKNGVLGVVDYAHTPDGLENILKTAKEFAKGRVIVVFGCGGDRDATKRPIMGEIAGQYADLAIITSDNPRTENPMEIIKAVEVGTQKTNCPYELIVSRKEAIFFAVGQAKKDDVVIVAGKGHETYQIFRDETIHFDDMEELTKALEGNQ